MTTKSSSNLSDSQVEEYYASAFALYEAGNWKGAADIFRLLCTRRPLRPKFWFGLGACLQEAKSFLDALHAWAMAALLKEEDPYPHFHAAECYLSLKNVSEAKKAFREVEERIEKSHPLQEKLTLLREIWEI